MNKDHAGIEALAVLGAFLAIPLVAVLEGWALTETWRLLLIPSAMDYAEVAIKPLSIGVAIAVTYTLRQFVSSGQGSGGKKEAKSYTVIFVTAILKPFMTVFFAWLLALFIFGGR